LIFTLEEGAMTPANLLVVAAIGLSASACSYTSTTAQAPVPAYRAGSEQACLDYGFRSGTDSYNRCVARDSEARVAGRVPRDYTTARLAADAQNACYSYGLTAGTAIYDRCIGREMEARRYRDEAYVTPAPTTYTVPSTHPAPTTYPARTYTTAPDYSTTTVYSPAPVTYAPAATTPPAGVQAFRDEFGFRYDGQGNRIDRNGNIISPQSTSR
jgi:hypothetical protein